MRKLVLAIAAAALLGNPASSQQAPDKPLDPENTLVIELKTGKVTIALLPDIAPGHVDRVKRLAREKFYDNVKWHRVITGFMAQTGDPQGTGMGGSKYPNLKAEFSNYAYRRGTVGAARTMDPNTANSQFFICFTDTGCRGLTGQYSVWGQVVEGMEHVDQIARGEPPRNPDVMQRVYILADAQKR